MNVSRIVSGVRQTAKNLSHSTYVACVEPKELAWSVLLTCEHASNVLPNNLQPHWRWDEKDLENDLPNQHWAIDLGAFDFTMDILHAMYEFNSSQLDGRTPDGTGCAKGVCAEFSRLLLDCNRPFGTDTMFRKECDGNVIKFNQNLEEGEKQTRKKMFFDAYHAAISEIVKEEQPKVVFSIHSFNPIYEGSKREMEVGVLFDDSSEELGTLVCSIGKLHQHIVF